MQVALDYAQKYDDFAAVVQPFFSDATCDNCTVDVLSDVSSLQLCSSYIATAH